MNINVIRKSRFFIYILSFFVFFETKCQSYGESWNISEIPSRIMHYIFFKHILYIYLMKTYDIFYFWLVNLSQFPIFYTLNKCISTVARIYNFSFHWIFLVVSFSSPHILPWSLKMIISWVSSIPSFSCILSWNKHTLISCRKATETVITRMPAQDHICPLNLSSSLQWNFE